MNRGGQGTSGSTVMWPPNRLKSATLWVSRREMPWANIVATMLVSWTCLPAAGMVVRRVSSSVVTAGPSSAIL